MPDAETFRDVDAQPVAWREIGAGSPVLLLHGIGMTRTGWDSVAATLADRHRCIAWDMPGYGASPPSAEPLTLRTAAAAAAGLVEAIDGPVHVVGLSMGGMVALELALLRPDLVRSLGLLDTSPAFGLDGTDPDAWRAARLAPLDTGARVEEFAEPVLRGVMAPDADPAAVAAAVASMCRVSIAGLRAAVSALPDHDVRDRLAAITAPTLVVVGELDEETPPSYAEALAAGIPGARLEVISGAGHLTPFEAPVEVARLIGDHLRTVEEV